MTDRWTNYVWPAVWSKDSDEVCGFKSDAPGFLHSFRFTRSNRQCPSNDELIQTHALDEQLDGGGGGGGRMSMLQCGLFHHSCIIHSYV